MSKELTEKYNDLLLDDGFYYVIGRDGGEPFIVEVNPWGQKYEVSDVLGPVPSHDHFSQLVKKVEYLQKQLEIATKALKKYSWGNNWLDSGCRGQIFLPTKCGYNIADKALDEMEDVK